MYGLLITVTLADGEHEFELTDVNGGHESGILDSVRP
jgi:hypothetical protein